MSSFYTSAEDVYRPSYFECVASDRLMYALKPVVKSLFGAIGRRWPRADWLASYHDEIFYGIVYFFERYYVRQYDSTFAENFYGLRRVKTDEKQNTTSRDPLSSLDQSRALFSMVFLPYLKSKLDNLFMKWSSPVTEDGFENFDYLNDSQVSWWWLQWRRCFVKFYPFLNAFYEGLHLIYQFRYLFEYTHFFTPLLHISKQKLVRLSMEDMTMKPKLNEEKQQLSRSWQHASRAGLIGYVRSVIDWLSSWMSGYFKWLVLLGIVVFKFLEWWYSPQNVLKPGPKLPIPPPPDSARRHPQGIALPADRSLCSLCHRKRTNAACIPSGYVFCYPCIFAHITHYQSCPVTLSHCTVEQIRKIYES
eukprot:TRINITY_DN1768_c0_g1_i1.p1 TRINITY_DN1768_c0_g1~~TRINITY_DN1768_c0_g1_i1.p1  ORF type:complete len:362 (+),score=28.46 TRINITY_DN1768_c0_g1_i1:31-1116(+)